MRLNNPLSTPIRSPLHGLFTDIQRFPEGAILHYDADIDAFSELTGGPHTFNHAILSPQYQRNADGSYTDVGAKPAVDVFDGEKWLRSCGAVTNLLPRGADNFVNGWDSYAGGVAEAVSINGKLAYRIADTTTGQYKGRSIVVSGPISGKHTVSVYVIPGSSGGVGLWIYDIPNATMRVQSSYSFDTQTGISGLTATDVGNGVFRIDLTYDFTVPTSSIRIYVIATGLSPEITGDVVVFDPQLTATAYPVPYTPPGTTMPASNATTTNGCWFALPDGSPLWQGLDGQAGALFSSVQASVGYFDSWSILEALSTGAVNTRTTEWLSCEGLSAVIIDYTNVYATCNRCRIQTKNAGGTITYLASSPEVATSSTGKVKFYVPSGAVSFRVYFTNVAADVATLPIQRIQPQPLTLATRVRMGTGSADWLTGVAVYPFYVSQSAGGYLQYSFLNKANIHAVTSNDGSATAYTLSTTWPRNAIIRRVTQVNTSGTQYRVGYMIEGTNTAIQWGSWVAFDGSFDPSTLYRLMLGYNNKYPMWFNKITAWKKQVTDAEILEAMA